MLQLKKKKKEETWGSSTVKLVNYSSLFVTKGNLTVDCVFTGKHEVYRTKHTRHGQEWIYLMMSYYMLVVGHLQRVYTAVAFSLALVLVGGGGGCRERDSSTKQTNDQMSPSVRHVFLLVSKNIRLCPVYTSARCATILPGCGMYGSPPAHKSRICCCRFWTIEPIRNELCKSLFSQPSPLSRFQYGAERQLAAFISFSCNENHSTSFTSFFPISLEKKRSTFYPFSRLSAAGIIITHV